MPTNDNTEELKSIRISLDYADENGKRLQKEQTIKVNKPVRNDQRTATMFGSHIDSVFTISFSIQIPEFIHSYLLGKSVPSTDYKEDFKKSISSHSIEQLTEKWCKLIGDYVWLKKIENADLKKVIFYQFDNSIDIYKSFWNGTQFGERSKISYKYAIGYISKIDDREIRYNSKKISVSSSNDKEFYQKKHVEWTEAREVFFIKIQKNFESICNTINDFESKLTEDSINGLIANSPLFLNQ